MVLELLKYSDELLSLEIGNLDAGEALEKVWVELRESAADNSPVLLLLEVGTVANAVGQITNAGTGVPPDRKANAVLKISDTDLDLIPTGDHYWWFTKVKNSSTGDVKASPDLNGPLKIKSSVRSEI